MRTIFGFRKFEDRALLLAINNGRNVKIATAKVSV